MSNFKFGPVVSDQGVEFRIWAPKAERVVLQIDGSRQHEMTSNAQGWHECAVAAAHPGVRYKFVLPDGLEVPDPASRYQPEDVHGPSEVVNLDAYAWKTTQWEGRPWEEAVIYEMHIGAFTREGTFLAAIERLDHLKKLGITAIQIMPVSDFPGGYGWGYDGVMPYAPDSSYGRPEDLQRLVDAAHARGICVFLDVVYNHFGPDGNYLPVYSPLFTEHHKTPWGNGINFDGDNSKAVREFVIENAIYWVTQYRLDGLRLDAVHAIKDDSEEHLLNELARRVREAAGSRQVHLIVENENNDSDLLARNEGGQGKLFTAQWNDDIHHVLHVAATEETFGYYADYADDGSKLGRALAEGFVFQGEKMPYRGEARGKPSALLPPTAFISFIQNHDQIGNRALGDRMISSHEADPLKAIAAVYLLAPQIPMLFMGEEWGAKEPFPFFCDFNEELNEKVRKGRREELSRLPGFDSEDLPDPTSRETFESAKLDWTRLKEKEAEDWLAFYEGLIAIRKARIAPLLKTMSGHAGKSSALAGEATAVMWKLADNKKLQLICNLSASIAQPFDAEPKGEKLFELGGVEGKAIKPWTVLWTIEA
ncbi:malto-oligosyltrehalose trehalohydrolase [Oryzifoliimicrobium ureilyticus]|uniref:malto-oligosyltrehalose trehalohydrolase n=1 Tax=Oryzifoliimicrobium ureilyticus TaxID=3113724 RepID=UPI0030761578